MSSFQASGQAEQSPDEAANTPCCPAECPPAAPSFAPSFAQAVTGPAQIDILNEDFQAFAGSNGQNVKWYNDSGSYWNSLTWDTNRYLNIYTNTASGNLGRTTTHEVGH